MQETQTEFKLTLSSWQKPLQLRLCRPLPFVFANHQQRAAAVHIRQYGREQLAAGDALGVSVLQVWCEKRAAGVA